MVTVKVEIYFVGLGYVQGISQGFFLRVEYITLIIFPMRRPTKMADNMDGLVKTKIQFKLEN